MGHASRAFKARLAPVVLPPNPPRGLTWPMLMKPDTPVTPKAQLSIQTEGCPCPPDLLWGLDEIRSAASVASTLLGGGVWTGARAAQLDEVLDEVLDDEVNVDDVVTVDDDATVEISTGSDDGENTTEEGKRKRRHSGRRGKAWIPPVAPNHFVARPCEHNSWDNVRVKKDKTTLRCRVCQLQWKVDNINLREATKCQEFHAHGRCSKGDKCTKVHVHRCKLNLSKRKTIWGDSLLIPRAVPDICQQDVTAACAAFERRSDTNSTENAYALATPHAKFSAAPVVSRRQSCTSTPTSNGTLGLRTYSHQPYDLAPSTAIPQLLSPVSTSLPDMNLAVTPSSMPSLWTAGASTPSRRGSTGVSGQQRRTSTGSGSNDHLQYSGHQGPASPPAHQAAQAAQAAARGYYQPPPLPLSGLTVASSDRLSTYPFGSAEAGPPADSDLGSRQPSSPIASYPSSGTLPVPHIVHTTRLRPAPPIRAEAPRGGW